VLVFNKLEPALQRKVVSEMYERSVSAGEILIKEGDSGAAASELYVVKAGKFEVSALRQAAGKQRAFKSVMSACDPILLQQHRHLSSQPVAGSHKGKVGMVVASACSLRMQHPL
jgi:CRP-like cAMP-binding protein